MAISPERVRVAGDAPRPLTDNVVEALSDAVVVVDANDARLPLILTNGAAERCLAGGGNSASLDGCSLYAFLGTATDSVMDAVSGRARDGTFSTSRVLPWARRPQAAALLAAMADPGRGFDAVVVGEYERAFHSSQYALMAPLFEHYGVQLWMPEAGGRANLAAEGDEQLLLA